MMVKVEYLVLISTSVIIYGAIRLFRARLYDSVIVKLTTEWYKEVLLKLPENCKLLDVGIGTGLALINNANLLQKKNIIVDGVDYDLDYIKRCRSIVIQHQLDSRIHAIHASIYDYQGGPYDAVYFSGSLMIMPDPVKALQHAMSMLKKDGIIYITQTIQTQRSIVTEYIKPLLKFITTIDFGQVTYEKELFLTFKKAGLSVVENTPISGSKLDSLRSFRLIILKP